MVAFLASGSALAQASVASLSTRRAGFDLAPVYVGFLVDKVETGQVFLPFLPVFRVSAIPTVFHAHPTTTDAICS